jgi:hypothetical protein
LESKPFLIEWIIDTDIRFFGSGVILATAVVHLLDPAIKQIGLINTYEYGGCISDAWGQYPYPVSGLNHLLMRKD